MSVRVDPLKNLIQPQLIYLLGYILFGFMILGFIDLNWFEGKLSNLATLSQYPSLYVPLIAFPHILSSLFILFARYKTPEVKSYVWTKIAPVVALGLLLLFTSKILFDLMFLILITQHIAGQTIGFLKLSNGKAYSDKNLMIWKWLNYPALAISFLMIYCVYLKLAVDSYLDMGIQIGGLFLLVSISWTAKLLIQNKKSSTHAMMLLLFQLYFVGVFYFAIKMSIFYWGLVFILGHDVMAFVIYHNYYSNLLDHKLKTILINLVIPLILSVLLITLAVSQGWPQFVFLFQFAHYFAERYCWTKDSPLRSSIGVKV